MKRFAAYTGNAAVSKRLSLVGDSSSSTIDTDGFDVTLTETANVAHVTWLREGEAPIARDYPLTPASRTTIDTGGDTELRGRSFGASMTFDQPGMAERAMYFGTNPMWMGRSRPGSA